MGGTSVVVPPGEEIQQAVLNHLQRLAISLGAPIHATIHDERAGCVVPLEVSADGSSRVTGEAVRTAARQELRPTEPGPVPAGTVQAPTGQFGPPPVMTESLASVSVPAAALVPSLVSVPSPAPVLTAVDEVPKADVLRAEEPAPAAAASARTPVIAPAPVLAHIPAEAFDTPAHTPARGFDAVAEEVLGDGPVTETAEGAELLTGPMTRINEAVRAGRIEAAAELADRTVTEAATVLGPGHAEVLHLRELSAYISYLDGDPVRAFEQSLDLARLRRQARDTEAAYGNVRSAATAWRAVRDPEEGLRMGHDLIELWTDLTAEPGPAADDPQPLESARARMVRLTDRAARGAQP
ncbi:hypothetical protein GQF42_25690 [Streptomyces broussonetiae]|uniref:Uncharacterized protein n=1 Tax=Streptomyces broussonetiae TaxID=2686304 RepID=A0A6I6NEK1_9ACTN|nr:hypothetical protein GQF42_25690 [Streptomyces broussonetiae]